jgi:lipopolysaccharide biosynthesis regulator YciM
MKMKLLCASFLLVLGVVGCENPEAKRVVQALNEDARVKACNAHVKRVQFTDRHHDAVSAFEADVLDENGAVVGKASGRRVEGFGTMRPGIEWYDETLKKKAQETRGDNQNRALRAKIMQADANGDGQVTYEEAVARNPHLLPTAFHYLDRNGDGVISKDDETYQGPRQRRRLFGF